jgi:small subunit ribosomal protein S20|tara:strand:- start:4244 stop:4501 length:258 start_codon:yes stop_codon:yes gene_type:complete
VPSAKAARVSVRKRMKNQPLKTKAKSLVTKARIHIEEGNLEAAEDMSRLAFAALDKAAQKGSLHKNNVSRRKSRLHKALNGAKVQ